MKKFILSAVVAFAAITMVNAQNVKTETKKCDKTEQSAKCDKPNVYKDAKCDKCPAKMDCACKDGKKCKCGKNSKCSKNAPMKKGACCKNAPIKK